MQNSALSHRNKTGKVYDEIRAMALRLGPDARLPTMTQLRDTLGASIATLDSVLSDLEARDIIRRKHGVGIYVASHVKKPIALLINMNDMAQSNASPFWSILLERMRDRAAQWSANGPLYATFDDDQSEAPLTGHLLESIERGRVQGIIGVGIPVGVSRQLIALDLPHVVYAAYGACMVTYDSDALTRQGVAALAAQGCRHIQLWTQAPTGHNADLTQTYLRKTQSVLRRALDENGLRDAPVAMRYDAEQEARAARGLPAQSRQEQGLHLAQTVFGGVESPPDGIVSGDDMLTFGALAHLRKLRLEVGRDVKIATHANAGSTILMGYEDQLTRLEYDPAELVETMFRLLEDWMRGEKPAEPLHYLTPRLRPEVAGV